jgi:peptidoglycan/xylan/chitin deacetylase (PgdA/CDA1 family)
MLRRSPAARGSGACAAVAFTAWCAPAPAPVVPPLASLLGIPLRLPSGRGIAVTFDDGPHPRGTPAVLEQLARAGAHATFYLVGEQVERWPTLAAEIATAGHEVAVHGHRHVLHLRRTPGALRDDLDRAAAVIGEATGRSSLSYRPPYGVFSLASWRLARARWRLQLWSHWGRDWDADASAASIAGLATRRLGPGAVILLHDSDAYSAAGSWRQTATALPAVLEAALATGEPLVTVSQST